MGIGDRPSRGGRKSTALGGVDDSNWQGELGSMEEYGDYILDFRIAIGT